MKKFLFAGLLFATMYSLSSCNDKNKQNNPSETNASQNEGQALKIAFINIDSMQTSLDYFQAKTVEFEKESEAIQNELMGIQRNIQNTAASMNKRIQNKDISDLEIQSTQKKLENMQINLQKKQESLSMSLMKKQAEFNNTLLAMLNTFTEEFNKEKGYDVIFTNTSAIYSNPKFNITSEFTPLFNDWINKKLKDEVMMKTFSEMGEKNAKSSTSKATDSIATE